MMVERNWRVTTFYHLEKSPICIRNVTLEKHHGWDRLESVLRWSSSFLLTRIVKKGKRQKKVT